MNFSTLIGLLAAAVIFIGTLFLTLANPLVFFEVSSILIVLGGTLAATLICFPLMQIVTLSKVFMRRLLGKARHNYLEIIEEVKEVSSASRKGRKAFESAIKNVSHPFLRDGCNVLFWLESEVSKDELRVLLETRAETHFLRYSSQAKIFKTISKFPPAFGLMGTTLGMIALLQSLGGGDNAKNMIGPAMAVALVTTLWGLALANFIFVPIAENLAKQTEEDLVARRMIVEAVMLIADEKPTKYIEEMVKGFLLPSERGEDFHTEGPGFKKAA